MNDADAEALLIALGAHLPWHADSKWLPHTVSARSKDGTYTLYKNRGRYECAFMRTPKTDAMNHQEVAYVEQRWWFQRANLATAQQAREWHVTKGNWPTEGDAGWEFLKQ